MEDLRYEVPLTDRRPLCARTWERPGAVFVCGRHAGHQGNHHARHHPETALFEWLECPICQEPVHAGVEHKHDGWTLTLVGDRRWERGGDVCARCGVEWLDDHQCGDGP